MKGNNEWDTNAKLLEGSNNNSLYDWYKVSRKRKRNKRRKITASSTGTSSSSASDEENMNGKEEIQPTKYGIEENQMVDLTKNCVNIIPCVETSQKESETYQTKSLHIQV